LALEQLGVTPRAENTAQIIFWLVEALESI
jgi:hypothetical protein